MQRHLVTINGRAHELTDVQFVDLNNFRSEVSRLEPKEYDDFLTTWTAKLVDSSKRGNMLYEIKGIIPKKKFKMLRYVDPSTQKQYLCFVPEEIKSADQGMAWKFYLTEEEYDGINAEA